MSAWVDDPASEPPVRRGRIQGPPIALAYEDWGNRAAPPLVLIMGIGAQMVLWPDGFCKALTATGSRVIRYDNRDVGLSGRFRMSTPAPSMWRLAMRAQLGLRTQVPYTLDDMADDALRLLDTLNIPQAHVVGMSLGGMIGQVMAARHPCRVRTLTLMSTSTNQPLMPPPAPRLLWKMRRGSMPAPAHVRQARIKSLLHALGTAQYPVPDSELEHIVRTMGDRGLDGEGVRRQMWAVLGTGDLRVYCRAIRAPTLVIHGTGDRMVPLAAGRAVARAIPGARLRLIPGMGHDLPPALWPMLARLIAEHVGAPGN